MAKSELIFGKLGGGGENAVVYCVGTANDGHYYCAYNSADGTITSIAYNSTGTLIDDDNVTISFAANHRLTITCKKPCSAVHGNQSASTDYAANSTVVSEQSAYQNSPYCVKFVL